MSNILSIENLNIEIENNLILKKITVDIQENKITSIIGPSGSGKSSFLKAINRLYPSNGILNFKKQSIMDFNIFELRKKIVYVQQEPIVFQGSVRSNIEWSNRIWKDQKIDPNELVKKVGLSEDLLSKDATKLSLGQKQRVHIARSLALNPEILLLDEPASALDAISKDKFEILLKDLMHANTNLTILVITHDLEQAQRIGDNTILIVDGEIKLATSTDEFFKKLNDLPQAEVLRKLMEANK